MPAKRPVRQFLYVDVDRVRSYLAQLDEGVLESAVNSARSDRSRKILGSALGLGGELSWKEEAGREEARSLQDLTFVIFEEIADAEGWLSDVPDEVFNPDVWTSGPVRSSMLEGQLLRVAADCQVFDPTQFDARLSRLSDFARAVVELTSSEALVGKSQREQERILKDAERKLWGEVPAGAVRAMGSLLTSLLHGQIALRVLPCGSGHSALSFGGVLLGRSNYIQQEREALFSRFGPLLQGWTIVMQIETVPQQVPFDPSGPDVSALSLVNQQDQIDRPGVEKMALEFSRFIDQIGFSEGPRWPSITVTPLAVYRHLPNQLLDSDSP